MGVKGLKEFKKCRRVKSIISKAATSTQKQTSTTKPTTSVSTKPVWHKSTQYNQQHCGCFLLVHVLLKKKYLDPMYEWWRDIKSSPACRWLKVLMDTLPTRQDVKHKQTENGSKVLSIQMWRNCNFMFLQHTLTLINKFWILVTQTFLKSRTAGKLESGWV